MSATSSRSSDQLALVVEEPVYFVPVCPHCGPLGAIPTTDIWGNVDPGNWKVASAFSFVALKQHERECPGRSA